VSIDLIEVYILQMQDFLNQQS